MSAPAKAGVPEGSRRHVNLNGSEGGWVAPTASVAPTAYVGREALVLGNARVSGSAEVSGSARVFGNAWVFGYARVVWNAQVFGYAQVFGNAWVGGNAEVSGNAQVSGNASVVGDARVKSLRDALVAEPLGSEGRTVTAYRTNDGHKIVTGCWSGTADELEARVLADTSPQGDLRRAEYLPFCAMVRARFGGAA